MQELKPSPIKHDNADHNKLITGIGATMDPFLADIPGEKLYCISTGKEISEDIAGSIFATQTQGQQLYEEFKTGCFADGDRFEKPISRRKVKSFACNALLVKLKTKDKKVKEL